MRQGLAAREARPIFVSSSEHSCAINAPSNVLWECCEKLLRCSWVATRVIPTSRSARHMHASRQMNPSHGTAPSDSGTAQNALSATSIGALRLWLQTQRSGAVSGRPVRHGDVQRAMQLVCKEVRRRGFPVERLIILLKEQWFTLTDDGDGGSLKSRDALEEIIRTCIDEFYASTAGMSAPPVSNANASASELSR